MGELYGLTMLRTHYNYIKCVVISTKSKLCLFIAHMYSVAIGSMHLLLVYVASSKWELSTCVGDSKCKLTIF